MNEPTSSASTDAPISPPRKAPRNFAEKRALFSKLQHHRKMQARLNEKKVVVDERGFKVELRKAEVVEDVAGEPSDAIGAAAKEREILAPPQCSKSSVPAPPPDSSTQTNVQTQQLQELDNIPSGKTEESSTSKAGTPKHHLETISDIITHKPDPSSCDDEFSDVFGGGLRTLQQNDLSKRVLDRAIFQSGFAAIGEDSPGVGGVDSFYKDVFMTDANGDGFSFHREAVSVGLEEEAVGTSIEVVIANEKTENSAGNEVENDVQMDVAADVGDKDAEATNLNYGEQSAQIDEGGAVTSVSDRDSPGTSQNELSAEVVHSCAEPPFVTTEEESNSELNALQSNPSVKEEENNSGRKALQSVPSKNENADTSGVTQDVDELNISNHSLNELKLSNIPTEGSNRDEIDRPRSSPVDPKLRRRHKMASRVASGKVNVPKSLLLAAATSANAVAELENGVEITVEKEPVKRGANEGSPGKQSTNSSPIANSSNTPLDTPQPNNVKPSITAISTKQSVELHASLDELMEFSLDTTCPSLPPSSPPVEEPLQEKIEVSAGKHSDTLEISFDSVNSNVSRDLDKNEARRQRRQLRRKDVSITIASGEEKNSKDMLGLYMEYIESVDEDEAKELFPLPSFDDTPAVGCPVTTEPAWDQNATSGLDAVLAQSKACHDRKVEDGKPLLELDAVSSDANNSEQLLAADKLISQHDRMTMYTSAKGFGVGEDSSIEVGQDSENDVDESLDVPCEYQTVDNENDESSEGPVDTDTFDFMDFGKGSHEEFSAAGSSAVQTMDKGLSDQRSDVVSDAGKRSDFFNDTNSSTTGGGTVLGLRFIGTSDSCKSRPVPPELMGEITPRAGVTRLGAVKERVPDGPKLFKIAPPPAEKLRLWEESKRRYSAPEQGTPKHATLTLTPKGTPWQGTHLTPNNTPPSIGHEKTLNLKISTPKSPNKKIPHSINEELNLSCHTKMAEKIAMASSKASRKFEEQYSHIQHDIQYAHSKSPPRSGKPSETHRFLCDSGVSFIPGNEDGAEADHSNHSTPISAGPGVVELVGGAFSPWKIPDRADEESNASSSRIMYDDASYAKASVAALKAIRGKPELDSSKDTIRATELSDLSIDLAPGEASSFNAGVEEESLLSEVLLWLFGEVLTSNAFSAFDIDTSTSVQAARVLAIANDDKSLNLICRHVTDVVIKRHGTKTGSPDKQSSFAKEILSVNSSGDLSTSSYESTQVTSVASSVTEAKSSFSERAAARILKGKKQSIEPFSIPISTVDARPPGEMLAANFISFLQQISTITGIPPPKPYIDNPFLQSVVNLTTKKCGHSKQERKSMQELVFDREEKIITIFVFLKQACGYESKKGSLSSIVEAAADEDDGHTKKAACHSPVEWKECLSSHAALEARLASGSQTLRRSNKRSNPNLPKGSYKSSSHRRRNLNLIFPKSSPSPFETAVWNDPSIMLSILSFLGNPVSVCMVKRLNVFCNRLVNENEHVLMRDAVRLGGMSKFVRPSFWLWVTMERCTSEDPIPLPPKRRGPEQSFSFGSEDKNQKRDFFALKEAGAAGKWQPVIERDVLRAFGNMPPHKTGAKFRQDSIVRALVSFGKEEIMRNSRSYQAMDKLPEESEARHFKLSSRLDRCADGASDDSSEVPTDTVSDWGGISPVGSMVSEEPSAATAEDGPIIADEVAELLEVQVKQPKSQVISSTQSSRSDVCDPVLSGNALTYEMKMDLQNKLRSILHALAAQHEGLGYCQGMDYIVAHLLRVLQDTILLRVIQGSMPILDDARTNKDIAGVPAEDWKTMPADQLRLKMAEINSGTMVVDEVVFRVMDAFFTTYGLQHMYWPELRCLKTCCRVFESLIKRKLPVLADHFEHHDLNVGLFALGWFQTLFLYLPSMPSATVCHMWDIWLVERSFKIFFRVGTAILFLSQPTLLNHDLEGMMTYLNTFPDATLLRRDILIPCALQIKITNRMLVEIEMDVTNFRDKPQNIAGEHCNNIAGEHCNNMCTKAVK